MGASFIVLWMTNKSVIARYFPRTPSEFAPWSEEIVVQACLHLDGHPLMTFSRHAAYSLMEQILGHINHHLMQVAGLPPFEKGRGPIDDMIFRL